MSATPESGTARHHLIKAATWLAAAEVVAQVTDKTPDQVQAWQAMALMAQAHATLGAAINADDRLDRIRMAGQ